MSLLKTNEIQNYNGSSLTLTASTVSTSAQLNTGGNISVTGSLNVSDDSTTRTNLGLGTIATQDSDSITVTGGSVTGTEIDLKSSGTTIFKSDGTTAVLSESGGTVTLTADDLAVNGTSSLDGTVVVNESGADVDFRIESDTNANMLFIDGGNNSVLVGTNTRTNYRNEFPTFQVHGSDATAAVMAVDTTDSDATNWGFITAKQYSSGAVPQNYGLGGIIFAGTDGSGTNFAAAGILAFVDGASSTGDLPGRLVFYTTADGASAYSERMRIDSSGNFKINNLSASSDVQTDASKNLITTSDARLKNEIGLIDESGIEVIKQIIPKYFSWKNDENNNQQLGFFAQDIYPVLPEAAPRVLKYTEVGRDENDEPILEQVFDEDGNPDYEWGFTDRPIIAMCVKSIQEQQTLIESQQSQIDALTARIEALETP